MSEDYEVTLGEKEWDFIPAYGEGKITCHLRQLTVEEYDSCVNVYSDRPLDRTKMVAYGLMSIKGLKINGKAITDANGLLTAASSLMALFTEVWVQVNRGSSLTEQESKN